jgi:hypothetical protein
MHRRRDRFEWTTRLIGLDRAVLFTLTARIIQIVSSIGTVLLIVRFLSPVAQGYYYTLLSLAALQTIFELGFSVVILQLAAHETAHLEILPDGRIEGDPVAHARLASVLQLTVRWYLRAAVALAALLLPLGLAFSRARMDPRPRSRGPARGLRLFSAYRSISSSRPSTPFLKVASKCGRLPG